ncbi:MAG TPA: hypothetical protein VK614_11545 [Allosphingosinicella sp.]|nr:hypothetical protein [Allosphingosinicella sp.]
MAQEIERDIFGSRMVVFEGAVGDAEPKALQAHAPQYLISFLSPWIVRKITLDRCGYAINFHPGSVEYPGTGCYNFALYEEARDYGAVCHHMLPKVDTGRVIREDRFAVHAGESVESLKLRTMNVMIEMYREVALSIAGGRPLPEAPTHWTRKPFTFRQMEALKAIDATMPPEEIARRIRATVYPGYPGPVLHRADGSRLVFPVPLRSAFA